ncbi:MAG: 3-dehydroquinate synthase [Chloroflexi bacterium]|nr:3-dehydroquinate synthase [Chloroflexota bacterium]
MLETFEVPFPLGTYRILLGQGLLASAGSIIRDNGCGEPIAIVTNPLVDRLHGDTLRRGLDLAGYVHHTITVPDGEDHKSLASLAQLYDRFLDLGLDRGSTVIALGGGVIGDLAGFAAATYMRGVPLVQVPTTLLAQVDASIGGKVAVDLPRGKNLVGAFYPARLVLTDTAVLRTLPPSEVRAGLAEIVKAAAIRSESLFELLEGEGIEALDRAVREAVAIKVAVVTEDPFERGVRAILNFGHTIGHGLETAAGYQLRHGDAVSVGMVAAARIAAQIGTCDGSVPQRIEHLLALLQLPTQLAGPSSDDVWQAMASDKKKRHGKLRYVLPVRIGEVVITDQVPEEVVRAVLEGVLC